MKIYSIGAGNMVQALMVPLVLNNKSVEMWAYSPSKTKAMMVAENERIHYLEKPKKLNDGCVVCLGHKPQQLKEVASIWKDLLPVKCTLFSMLAGVSTDKLKDAFGVENIIRIMPNTPSMVGHGVNALYFSSTIDEELRSFWVTSLSKISKVFVFDKEEDIELITPFSGSGPAYVFQLSNLLINKMVSMGVAKERAKEMVVHTFLGASKMMAESDLSPGELRTNVTSKAGVTFEALQVFEDRGLESIVDEAIDKAYQRALELGK